MALAMVMVIRGATTIPLSYKPISTITFSKSLSSSISFSPSSTPLPFIYCGRGDKKTAKGKRFNHSFGNARPRNKNKGRGPPRAPVSPSPPKKDRFDDTEKVKIEIEEF